jgi:hypothetical protein
LNVRARLKEKLASWWSVVGVAVLAALLTSPSLRTGLVFDDYFFAVVLRKLPLTLPQKRPLDLYRFADGDPKTARALMDTGTFAWTSDPSVRNAFLRPLSALTHVLDYAVWPRCATAMHAQSILWLALAVAGAALVYRRLLGATWIAGLAALLYAVDDAHGATVSWLANRNALVAAALGFPVLWLHDRWRKDGWRLGAWLAPALLAIDLLAGEAAIAVAAYLAAYAIHLERGAWKQRASTLAPYALVVVAWRVVYAAFGFGVVGSDLYLDPAHEPLLFLAAFPRRYPALLLGQLALPKPDSAEIYALISPSLTLAMTVFAFVVLALLALAFANLWKRDAVARFFATGLLLAAVPIAATAPGDRLLLFVGLGAMGLIAQLIASATTPRERAAATFFVALHLVLAPVLLARKSKALEGPTPQDLVDRAIPTDPGVATKTVVIVNPPNDGFAGAVVATRLVRGEPGPRYVLPLAGGTTALEVTRVDARSLRVRPDDGFLQFTFDRNWRRLDRPLLPGSTVELSAMTVTVLDATDDLRPQTALFRFNAPLEDSSFVWRRWNHGAYAPWTPPAIGETVHLAANGFREGILDLIGGKTSAR